MIDIEEFVGDGGIFKSGRKKRNDGKAKPSPETPPEESDRRAREPKASADEIGSKNGQTEKPEPRPPKKPNHRSPLTESDIRKISVLRRTLLYYTLFAAVLAIFYSALFYVNFQIFKKMSVPESPCAKPTTITALKKRLAQKGVLAAAIEKIFVRRHDGTIWSCSATAIDGDGVSHQTNYSVIEFLDSDDRSVMVDSLLK